MLYWNNPPPIYPMTYIFRVFPRKKADASGVLPGMKTGYFTTFFWGNNGIFEWQTGNTADTYYGMHPYPGLGSGAPNGRGSWEISVIGQDIITGQEVGWDRWYTQAMRVRRVNATTTEHEFYYDWNTASPPTSCVAPVCESFTVNDASWAQQNPPTPSIVVGQAADRCGPPPGSCNMSWGGYPGWEEFNGVIRGMQFYTSFLSLTDIQAEINSPKSSTAGASSIWYLNIDPRPSDVTDKKNVGTVHNPIWDGTTALQWSSGSSPAPNAPSGLRVQ